MRIGKCHILGLTGTLIIASLVFGYFSHGLNIFNNSIATNSVDTEASQTKPSKAYSSNDNSNEHAPAKIEPTVRTKAHEPQPKYHDKAQSRIDTAKVFGLENLVKTHIEHETAFENNHHHRNNHIHLSICSHFEFWREQLTEQIIYNNWVPKTQFDHQFINMVIVNKQWHKNYYLYEKKSFEQAAIAAGSLSETDLWDLLETLINLTGHEADDLICCKDQDQLIYQALNSLNDELENVREDIVNYTLSPDQESALNQFKTIKSANRGQDKPTLNAEENPSQHQADTLMPKQTTSRLNWGDKAQVQDYFNQSSENRKLLSTISEMLSQHADEILRIMLNKLSNSEHFAHADRRTCRALIKNMILSDRSKQRLIQFGKQSPKHAAFAAKQLLYKLVYIGKQQFFAARLLIDAKNANVADLERLKQLLVKRMVNTPNLNWLKSLQLTALKKHISAEMSQLDYLFDSVKYWQDDQVDDLLLKALHQNETLYRAQIYKLIHRHKQNRDFFDPTTFANQDQYQRFVNVLIKMSKADDDFISRFSTIALASITTHNTDAILFSRLKDSRHSIVEGAIAGLTNRYIEVVNNQHVFSKNIAKNEARKQLYVKKMTAFITQAFNENKAWKVVQAVDSLPDHMIWHELLPKLSGAYPIMARELIQHLYYCVESFSPRLHQKLLDSLIKILNKTSHEQLKLSVIKLLGKVHSEQVGHVLFDLLKTDNVAIQMTTCDAFRKRYLKSGADYYHPDSFQGDLYQRFFEQLKKICLNGKNNDIKASALRAIRHYLLSETKALIREMEASQDTWFLGAVIANAKEYHPGLFSYDQLIEHWRENHKSLPSIRAGLLIRTYQNAKTLPALFDSISGYNTLCFENATKALLNKPIKSRYQILANVMNANTDMSEAMIAIDLLGRQSNHEATKSLIAIFDRLPSTMHSDELELTYKRAYLQRECIDARRTWSPRLAILYRLIDHKTDTVKKFMKRVSKNTHYRKEVQQLAQQYRGE